MALLAIEKTLLLSEMHQAIYTIWWWPFTTFRVELLQAAPVKIQIHFTLVMTESQQPIRPRHCCL